MKATSVHGRLFVRALAGAARVVGSAATLGMLTWAIALPAATSHADQEKQKEEEPLAKRAVIRFVDLGGIDDWRADGSEAILIKGRNGEWFRATFLGPCFGVRFAESIGFVTDATGDLDRFSSILVAGERCYFRSLDKIPDPLPVPKAEDDEED